MSNFTLSPEEIESKTVIGRMILRVEYGSKAIFTVLCKNCRRVFKYHYVVCTREEKNTQENKEFQN